MTKAIIIDLDSRQRSLDPRKSKPISLVPIREGLPSSMQWSISALEQVGINKIVYLGRYHIEKVIRDFSSIQHRYVPSDIKGELNALLLHSDLLEGDCLLFPATTVLTVDGISKMLNQGEGQLCHGVMMKEDNRSLGVIFSPSEMTKSLSGTVQDIVDKKVSDTKLQDLIRGPEYTVALDDIAATIKEELSIANLIFQGKAKTLENLAPLTKKGKVLSLFRFTKGDWSQNSDQIIANICEQFAPTPVVVRSSTIGEDSLNSSAAGQFLSLLNVDTMNRSELSGAIEDVIASYSDGGRAADQNDEVLIQPFLENLNACGVLLTREPQHSSPYFVINVDSESRRSDVVTSGAEGVIETYYYAWNAPEETVKSSVYASVLEVGKELIQLSNLDGLDIEFATTDAGETYLLQARPMTCVKGADWTNDDDVLDVISFAREYVEEICKALPQIAGKTNILSNMSDWNPAEMIGAYPRPLALSLYQSLIGNHSWADARKRLGYKDMTSYPLILSLAGRPYVDVRASFNSMLPAGLDNVISEKWVNHCLARLSADPALHDKIEFEIAVTCLTPSWPKHRKWMEEAGLNEVEIEQFKGLLLRLTEDIMTGRREPLENLESALKELEEKRNTLLEYSDDNVVALGRKIRHLVRDCERLGLVSFSIMARYGFIAMSVLKGLKEAGAISESAYDSFLHSIPTVSSQLTEDKKAYAEGTLSKDGLLSRYGHLRPNSYDILSRNYMQQQGHVLMEDTHQGRPHEELKQPIEYLEEFRGEIEQAMANIGLKIDLETLSDFMASAISGRERFKFEFMKNVNAVLECIAKLGDHFDLGREVLSFVPLDEFIKLESNSSSSFFESHIRRLSGQNEKSWLLSKQLRFPDLIRQSDEVVAYRLEAWRPNYITRKTVKARVVLVESSDNVEDLDGAIVCICAADPGYDWLFSHNIAGLITQYGGVASHMSIRAAEFGLPAAVGCGEYLFNLASQADIVHLDCEHHKIEIVE